MASHALEEAAAGPEPGKHRYDTFISFRGEEMRWNFICHLYHALSDAGICTFKDDAELHEGDEIQPELNRAILSSKISVVVFSTSYADSRWCLDELVEIINCRKTRRQLVIPVFCDVDPVDILYQRGPFAEAFDRHVKRFNEERVHMWREALKEAYHLRGLTLNSRGGDQGLLVKHLVRYIEILLKDMKYQEVVEHHVSSSGMQLGSPPQTVTGSQESKQAVFICCRGAHIGKTFASHLRHALTDTGIYVMRGDDELPLGEDISYGFMTGSRSCRMSVVVFSRGFAESRWCLNKLVEVMKWSKTTGHLVIPVFYYVDPSDVRGQCGTFAEAFAPHEQICSPEVVARWRAAMEAAGNLSGHVLNSTFRDEALTVERIVRHVSNTLNDEIYLPVATFPVGLDSRVLDINLLISADSEGVRFVGILGMGGIGKTTLAKAIYNQFLHHFEAKCFLAEVRANSERSEGLVRLQEQLLHDVLRFKRHQIRVHNVDEGISIIKKRLHGQKVFVVLDDVSDPEQVRKLVGGRELFGSGSIVIVTRYQDVLNKMKVDCTYNVQRLNDDESLELFCSNAFGEHYPIEGSMELSKEVIKYTKGVPLALELLGRALNDRSKKEWIDTIEELKTIPNHDLQSKLRISFDALGNDDRVKKLFLEIACYFVGYDKDYVVRILEACSLFPEKGIGVLTRRCLIEVDENNKLKMHDLLRDMGREIAREKSPDDPGKRNHLWLSKDILSTLRSHSGTREVEGIALDLEHNGVERVNAEAFAPMNRLKLLKLNNVHIDGKYKHISKELRWLCWHHFSLNFIPEDFYMGELVTIDMQYSNLIEIWKDNMQFLGNLKVLNLSHSHSLIRTPDFSRVPNLQELSLDDCTELTEVHPSIGHLERLELASFKDCTKLKNFPETVSRIKSLQVFNICGCSKIDKLPEDIGQMQSLTNLLADGTVIAHLPSSIGQLKSLMYLSFCYIKRPETISLASLVQFLVSARHASRCASNTLISSLSGLSSLRMLKLMDCGLSDNMIPVDIGSLLALEDLDLRKNEFCSLPETIGCLTQLKRLQLDDCINLVSLPDMPASLFSLSAINCVSLNRISSLEFGPGIRLFLTNRHKLRAVSGLGKQEPDGSIHLEQCSNLTEEFKEFLIKDWCGHGSGEVFLPGFEIPKWFNYRTWGSSLSFPVPTSQGAGLKGFTICILYASNTDNEELRPYPTVYMAHSCFSFSSMTHASIAITPQSHRWAFFLPYSIIDGQKGSSDEVKLSVDFGDGWNVKGIGVHIIKDVVQSASDNTGGSASARAEQKRCFHTAEAGSNSDTPLFRSSSNLASRIAS